MDYIEKIAQSLHKDKYREDIDGIRAIAVLLVVICHGFPSILPSGFIGVDIFFVISGYLITTILIKDFEKERFSIKTFYIRRVKRIFPALITVLLFTLALGWYCLLNNEFFELGKHIIASNLFSENLLLWSQSSYFDTSSELKPTLHLWSLAIEEQFYIFWPLIILCIYKFRLKFIYILILLISVSFVLNFYDVYKNNIAAYYSPLGRSWELLVGACLAYFTTSKYQFLNNYKNSQSIIGFTLIIIGLFLARPQNFPGTMALFPTLGTFFLISAGPTGIINRYILSIRPLVWVGLISYPLYLWHWPLMSFSHIILGKLPHIIAIGCILLSILAAYLTFIYIEKPIRTSKKHTTFPLSFSMVLILFIGIGIYSDSIKSRLHALVVPSSHEWRLFKSITPEFEKIKNSTAIYKLFPEREKQTLFIGDSHLVQYSERVNKYLQKHPEMGGAVFAVGGNCLPILHAYNMDVKHICSDFIENAYKMANEKNFRHIVIGGAWNAAFFSKNFYYQDQTLNTIRAREKALSTLALSIQKLESKNIEVTLILDNPKDPNLGLTTWKTRLQPSVLDIKPNLSITVDPKHMTLNQELIKWAEENNIKYINPYYHLCNNDSHCYLTDDKGIFIFKDNNHLNPDWVKDHAVYIDDIFKNKAL